MQRLLRYAHFKKITGQPGSLMPYSMSSFASFAMPVWKMKALLSSQSLRLKSKASKLLISWLSANYFLLLVVTLISRSVRFGLFWFCWWGVFLVYFFMLFACSVSWMQRVQVFSSTGSKARLCSFAPALAKSRNITTTRQSSCCHTTLPKQFPFTFQVCTQANYSHTIRTTLSI